MLQYITSEHRSAFLDQMREMVNGKRADVQHVELHKTRMRKDEDAVSAVQSLIQSWVNPFMTSHDLISISTARTAPQEIASDL